jgi:hypothetical protein
MGKGTKDELRSSEDLKDCQEGREIEIPDCQEGNRLRSAEDLKDCHEDSQGISHCQLGNERRSYEDLEDCQEGSEASKTARRTAEACQTARWAEMKIRDCLKVSWTQRRVQFSKEC